MDSYTINELLEIQFAYQNASKHENIQGGRLRNKFNIQCHEQVQALNAIR